MHLVENAPFSEPLLYLMRLLAFSLVRVSLQFITAGICLSSLAERIVHGRNLMEDH